MRTIGLIFILFLAACNRGDGPAFSLDPKAVTPDEFMVTTTRPLQIPQSVAELPAPLLGSGNLADIDPNVSLRLALGGNGSLGRGGIAASDRALIAAAVRNGTTPDIREMLATEDAALRQRRSSRLKNLSEDGNAGAFYSDMLLDPYAEMERLSTMGVRVPTAPPR